MLLNDKQRNFIELCYKEFGILKKSLGQNLKVEKKQKVSFSMLVSKKNPKIKKFFQNINRYRCLKTRLYGKGVVLKLKKSFYECLL
ncbi:MAG: hypothetical protein CM15mV8_1260 [Caudoviricetes sp.]|nr:MAG: hypothetical protein CM15mV8_1260 [Caudoviricetes sp.]